MRVCLVFQDQYPWDVRIEKFLNSIANAKLSVNVVSRNRSNLPRHEKLKEKIFIDRLMYFENKIINEAWNTPAFFSLSWIFKIISTVKKNKSKIIVVRDLPLSPSALIVGKLMKIPVVLDMAENYPAMLADSWTYGKMGRLDFFIRNPKIFSFIEKKTLKHFNKIIVVSDESKARIESFGVLREKISVVGNTPLLNKITEFDAKLFQEIRSLSKFILIYVGGLEETRGVEVVVKAIPDIKKTIPDVVFLVVGDGKSLPSLKNLTKNLGLEKNILYLGWRAHKEISSIINASDIGIIPHYVTEHTDTTLPNKLYDYMLQKKPVISANSKSLCAVLEKNKCGFTYDCHDPDDLSKKVKILFNHDLRVTMGENGYRAVKEVHNWEVDEKVLLETLSSCLT